MAQVPGSDSNITAEAAEALRNTYAWLEVNSGWAPPDPDELAEWLGDAVCRCPDECLVAPDACCEHGLASWWLILEAQSEYDARDHRSDDGRAGGAT